MDESARQDYRWKFFRAGGFEQVRLDSGADLGALPMLDQKLWVALSAPVTGLEMDTHTLELLDLEKDGRIRVRDVLAATEWTLRLLTNPDELIQSRPALPLASIDTRTDDGRELLASAREILRSLGKPDALEIAPADTKDRVKILEKTIFNGDGIIIPESAESDTLTAKAITDIIACFGAERDASGKDGVSKAKVDQFFKEAQAYVDWWKNAERDPEILPLGDRTEAAYRAVEAVEKRIDDWYARCALVAMDARAQAALHPSDATYAALALADPETATGMLQQLPLARIEPSRALPLVEGVNPNWVDAIGALRTQCVVPFLGDRTALTREEWLSLGAKLGAHRNWLRTKPAQAVEKLGIARLKDLIEGQTKDALDALFAKEATFEPQARAIASVDRLAHYYRDLHTFLNNFVSFRDFYAKKGPAVFQAGTLYIDGRSCDLCLHVDDIGKHSTLATSSMMYLAYCACVRKGGTEKMTIGVAITGGDSSFLLVGRNGVFYDRKGQDWDATITKIVEQPVSLREAFWSPYRRVAKFIGDQVEKAAGAKEKASSEAMTSGVVAVGEVPAKAGAPAAGAVKTAAPFDVAKFAGIFAAIGLALGAIGTALAAVVTGFMGLTWWQMPLAIFGALAVVSGPAMILAAIKLRRRNLGPLLDASGWAINARAKINIPFGASLTKIATLPAGAQRSLRDPYADKRTPWWAWALLLLVLAISYALLDRAGVIDQWIHSITQRVGEEAPKPPDAPPPVPPPAT